MLLVCLHMRTLQAIHASGRLGVNILDENQGMVAERFACRAAPTSLRDLTSLEEGGVPLLADSAGLLRVSRG